VHDGNAEMTTEAKWSDFSSLDSERTLAAVQQLLPKWVTLLLAIAVAWQLARIFWMLMPGSVVGDPIEVSPAQYASAGRINDAQAGSADGQAIADAHLFGEANADDVEVVVQQEPTENLAETRLSLTLKGTIAAASDDDSFAIIADQSNDEKVYGIGDAIVGGTKLHAVYADRVILNESGALKALKLPREFPDGMPTARRSNTSVNRSAATNNRSIQNVVSQNVTKLADVIRPTPYFVAGQQEGYRVYPGRDRKQFAALGLRPGDLIKDIDGAALTDPKQAMEIFQNLGSSDQVSVTVERNGQPEVLVLKTSQLNLDNNE
jgi:general secretion pathway protein C